MEVVQEPVFRSLGQALSYFNSCNPARQKPVNFFEQERGHKPADEDFSGRSPSDIWAAITLSIERVLGATDSTPRWCWIYRNVGPKENQLAAEEIAERMHLSVSKVYFMLRKVNDRLEDELAGRGVVPRRER